MRGQLAGSGGVRTGLGVRVVAGASRVFDGPRERLARHGPSVLSEAELIALLLRTGVPGMDAMNVARLVLDRTGGLTSLARTPVCVLETIPGLGPAKAASLAATFEVARRLESEPLELSRPIRSPCDVERHFAPRVRSARRESFFVLLLDGRHRLIAEEEVSRGTLTSSLVHPREVFREAIRSAAGALVLVHNHPSGDPTPSAEDRSVTTRLAEAGRLLGIEVIDHVVVSNRGHYSFRESREAPWDRIVDPVGTRAE